MKLRVDSEGFCYWCGGLGLEEEDASDDEPIEADGVVGEVAEEQEPEPDS